MVLFGPKLSIFDFKKIRILIFLKKSCSLKIAAPEFQKYKRKKLSNLAKDLKSKHKHELFHRYFFKDFAYFLGTAP